MRKIIAVAVLISLSLAVAAVAEEDRPLILVTNDDGIGSEGLAPLVAEMAKIGEVVVAAPLNNKSGVGHGITYREPISYGRSDAFSAAAAWWVDAMPASCVRWALATRLDGRKVDLVVSGINDGSNLGAGIYYSGTVGAAREGALAGAVAIAFSIDRGELMDYAGAAARGREIAQAALRLGRRPLLFNVNFPAGKIDADTPLEVTGLTRIRWNDVYHDRESPRGGRYFWITYDRSEMLPEEGSDAAAVLSGRISITPLAIMKVDSDTSEALRDLLSR